MGENEANEPGRTSAPNSQPESVPGETKGEGGGIPGERQAAPELASVPPSQDTKVEPGPEPPGVTLGQKSRPTAYRTSKGRWSGRVTLATSVLSLLVIIIHTYYYDKQWDVMIRQTELVESQVKQSTDAFTLQERAWLFMHETNFAVGEFTDLRGVKAKRAKGSVGFRNSGDTPSQNTKVWFCAQIRERPLPEDAPKPQLPAPSCREVPFGIIGPNAVFSFSQADEEIVVDQETTAKLDSLELKLYVWGVVEYEDFFQRRRMTRFCFTNSFGTTLLTACENNNRAD